MNQKHYTSTLFQYDFGIECNGTVCHGLDAIVHGPVEKCRPAEPTTVEVDQIFIVDMETGNKTEIKKPTQDLLNTAKENLMTQSIEDEIDAAETEAAYREDREDLGGVGSI
tara:strand:- start:577 stop:909 length:333 start_codon:yes stop_codon:yes gene_type:complete